MEEESWASCGNRDYLTPWDLSSLSTKSSPMLSMMLGVEEEDWPSCNSWSPSLMCMNIIFNVSSSLLPQFSSTSCTKSWSQSLLLIVVASFNSSLSHCYLIFMNFFFQFPDQNMYWDIAPLRSAWIFLFNESSFAQNWFRARELCPFHPSAAICPDKFQNTQRPMFLPYLFVRVFKFIDLGCVGTGISWSFWISTFYSLYVSVHVQNLMKTAGFALKLLEMLTKLISSLIMNSSECFVMPAKQSSAHTTPGVTVGSRDKCQQTNHP